MNQTAGAEGHGGACSQQAYDEIAGPGQIQHLARQDEDWFQSRHAFSTKLSPAPARGRKAACRISLINPYVRARWHGLIILQGDLYGIEPGQHSQREQMADFENRSAVTE